MSNKTEEFNNFETSKQADGSFRILTTCSWEHSEGVNTDSKYYQELKMLERQFKHWITSKKYWKEISIIGQIYNGNIWVTVLRHET